MTASNDTDALFYPFLKGTLSYPAASDSGRALFVNAAFHTDLADENTGIHVFLQHDFVQAFSLTKAGFPVLSAWPAAATDDDLFDMVLVRLPKQRDQAHYFMARGLSLLREGGTLVCAAANDAGGGRIEKDMRSVLGGAPCFSLSKYKARVVWGQKDPRFLQRNIVADWTEKGALQKHKAHGFWTQPGIFGWDKVDKGSSLLMDAMSGAVEGTGADFGCGYGYLSTGLCRQHREIKEIYCIDSDKNAIKAARRNLDEIEGGPEIHTVWDDLIAPVSDYPLFDWVVMNPPFHDGKKEDAGIGTGFIKTAAKMLRPGGRLWMVANRHLPYEKSLKVLFQSHDLITEKDGFKIYCAIK